MTTAPMKPLAVRRLAAGERALAEELFAGGLDAGRVQILALPLWRRAFVAGPGLIVWPAVQAWRDFSTAPLRLQAMLAHELTHVWQAQRGVFLPWAKLRAGDGAAAYAYDLRQQPDFAALNIEQQAMVVEHAFLAARGAEVPHPAALYVEASAAWRSPPRPGRAAL